jgi:8-oxo-dGTP pyrophosphatase MutT (NUDIX family)
MNAWVLRRQAARVVLLNDRDQIFLIKAVDPADSSKPPWWEIPGGGIDPGEASEQAAYRELHEEAGVTEAEVGPVVWVQHVEFDFGGYHFDQDEVIHVARTAQRDIRPPQGLEALEALAFKEARWWTLDEVQAADAENIGFLPPRLPDLLAQLIDGPLPDPPLDISPHPPLA